MPNSKEYPFGQDWFHVKQMGNDVWAIREPKHSEDVLCFFVKGSKQSILIDTGMGLANLKDILDPIIQTPC